MALTKLQNTPAPPLFFSVPPPPIPLLRFPQASIILPPSLPIALPPPSQWSPHALIDRRLRANPQGFAATARLHHCRGPIVPRLHHRRRSFTVTAAKASPPPPRPHSCCWSLIAARSHRHCQGVTIPTTALPPLLRPHCCRQGPIAIAEASPLLHCFRGSTTADFIKLHTSLRPYN